LWNTTTISDAERKEMLR
jgi:hypothetical protein